MQTDIHEGEVKLQTRPALSILGDYQFYLFLPFLPMGLFYSMHTGVLPACTFVCLVSSVARGGYSIPWN